MLRRADTNTAPGGLDGGNRKIPQISAGAGSSAGAGYRQPGRLFAWRPGAGAPAHPRSALRFPTADLAEPFQGITCDGTVRKNLFVLEPNGAPVEAMTNAARAMLAVASADELQKIRRPIDSEQWRKWSNPEFYVFRDTLRLEEHGQPLRDAILNLLQASMSPNGFAKAVACMRINHFLGELVGAPKVLNQYSYNFCLFGEPSLTEPWGWQYFGHHLCLNCFVVGRSMTISPTFMGAEPNVIDVGPYAGTTVFRDEERVGLQLMQSLTQDQKDRARIYKLMKDPAMPEGRWIFSDQRHLGGCYRDNLVIPYEGVLASELTKAQRRRMVDLVGAFVEYLPAAPLAARLAQVERLFDQTYLSGSAPMATTMFITTAFRAR